MADSLHTGDPALLRKLLHAAERCKDANREFLAVLEQLRPNTAAGEAARTELVQHLQEDDCGEKLLQSLIEGSAQQAEIHTAVPPGKVQ